MLDNLISLVKEHAGEAIINNNAIPNERNDEAIAATAGSIFDTLKSQASSGNLNGIMDMFKNSSSGGAISNNVASAVAGSLAEKFGLNSAQAGSIVSSLVPVVMDKFVQKTNDPNDKSFDLQDVVKNIGGGNLGGMLGGLGSLFK